MAGAAIDDREGFTAGSVQFDSDIRDGRHPRAALGIDDDRIVAVVCDGRADDEAGLTLPELAALMVSLGVRDAINLDGGGSATLIAGGRMLNRPRASWNVDLVGGRPLATALAHPAPGGRSAPGERRRLRVELLHLAGERRPREPLQHACRVPPRPRRARSAGSSAASHQRVRQRRLVVRRHQPAGAIG